jgi:hypothetical protein
MFLIYSGPFAIDGREAADIQGAEHSLVRQAKYFPVPPGGFSIGMGTKSLMTGNRKKRCARVRGSLGGGSFRNPCTNGPLITKSLLPSTITGASRLASRKFFCRSVSVSGMDLDMVTWNCEGGSSANAVNAETKQSKKTFVFIKPFS